ncbi:aromatic-L-amino-acid decarboxylase [Prunus yedoensis var. nudiflora]|uniref:Aromatic-L-amino-acid decarboxylase n=1 Tax=Prunus yedoensis var. nudiflora TaxID=2094558 RepID=A0A314YGX4_PRUYE|nr:aromatic-L-amino-acid decarboxylase [Prunus yedoensis var. nudiflora]
MGSLDVNFTDSSLSQTDVFKPLDPEDFRKQAHQMVDFIADYYAKIESYPVLTQVQPNYLRSRLPSTAPTSPNPCKPSSTTSPPT